MPDLQVHLHLESVPWMRIVQLVTGGSNQSVEGWHRLSRELKLALPSIKVTPNLWGPGLLIVAGALATVSAAWLIRDPQAVVLSFHDFIRR
jgi:hypothetical protein